MPFTLPMCLSETVVCKKCLYACEGDINHLKRKKHVLSKQSNETENRLYVN